MLLAALACAAPGSARAIEPAPTRPPIDEDFVLQGEYAGCIEQSPACSLWSGVQVVALGDGRFEAVEFSGGLPGNGGTMERRVALSGTKAQGTVLLTARSRRMIVRGGTVVVQDADGRELGRLQKYHRLSQTLRERPPPGAIVLFDGTNVDRFTNGTLSPEGWLNAGADTKESFGDFSLHLEFRIPYAPPSRDQGRGNSGVYIQGRYEVQILDTFGLDGGDRGGGSLYRTRAPLVNMCFPPLSWQTYDIDFTAARFDPAGSKTRNARITVRHNGIVIHKDCELPDKTGAGAPEGPEARPLRLQQHGSQVHFRNIWVVERRNHDGIEPAGGRLPCTTHPISPNACRLLYDRCTLIGGGALRVW
jgi:hypothetical protein